MNHISKLISFLGSRVGYWLGAAELATAVDGSGRLAAWVISLLEIQPADRILEIGCGPDMVMKSILKAHKHTLVAAVDPSALLIEQAWQKNARAIKQGRAMLIQAAISHGLPAFSVPFTKVVGVNPAVLTDQPVESLKAVRAAMAPRGKIVLAVQSADKDATDADARRLAKEIRQRLAAAGFVSLWLSEKNRPAPASCVTAINPAIASSAPPGNLG